jgi:uncharacterized protein YqgQ
MLGPITGPLVLINYRTTLRKIIMNSLSLQDTFGTMTAIELKTLLSHRISEKNDISFLKALKIILDSKTDTGVIQLRPDQLHDIIASKKEIGQGLFIENSVLDKEVCQWLNAR